METLAAITSGFGFHLEFVGADDRLLLDRRLRAGDFQHAVRHTLFEAVRRGLVDDFQPLPAAARIAPLFPAGDSQTPRARGFTVTIPLAGGGQHTTQFGINYFASTASRVRAQLLRSDAMSAKGDLYYRLNAFLDEEDLSPPASKLPISLEPATHTTGIRPGFRRDYGPTEPWDKPSSTDLPVMIDIAVLEEVVAEANADPDREIAGFLLGHVLRDGETGDVFVAATGLASADGTTEANGTSVTFTPASFAHARRLAALRAAGEVICGWFHSHPFRLCAGCPLPASPACISKVLFYSLDDIHLMESTFDQPFMLGLLAAVDARIQEAVGHLPVRLYGWCHGEIKPRGFDVVRSATD